MTQIENGMIIGAEKYDPQCQDIKMQRCTVCREMWPQGDLTYYAGTGDWVCPDCRMQYLREQGADFVNEYIRQNEWDFYANWLFANADREEQLRVIKAGYLAENTSPIRHDYMESQKVDFCKEDDGFLQFVKEKLL